jgi:O-antigen ligase
VVVYFLVIFLLFLLQFIYIPWGVSYFEVPKVYIAEIGMFSLLLFQVFKGAFSFVRFPKSYLFLVGGVFVLSLYHLLFLRTEYTFWGNPFRMQGVFLLWLLVLFSMASRNESVKRVSSLFVSVVLCVQAFLAFWVDSGSLGRAVGTLAEPNSLAGEMVFLWPFVYFSLKQRRVRWIILLIVLLISGIVILISGSRSGIVALALQLVFFVCIELFHFSVGKVTLLCMGLLFLSYSLPFLEQGNVYENRGEVWQSAVVAGMLHPLLGNGFGNSEFALHKASLQLHNNLQGYYVDSSHTIFLDWFVQGGIVGLVVLLVVVFQTVKQFIAERAVRNLLLLVGLLGVLSFNPVSVTLLVAFWWLLGQGIGCRRG